MGREFRNGHVALRGLLLPALVANIAAALLADGAAFGWGIWAHRFIAENGAACDGCGVCCSHGGHRAKTLVDQLWVTSMGDVCSLACSYRLLCEPEAVQFRISGRVGNPARGSHVPATPELAAFLLAAGGC